MCRQPNKAYLERYQDMLEDFAMYDGFILEDLGNPEASKYYRDNFNDGLKLVEREQRPFLLDVRLPLGLPSGGQAAASFRLK
jgi:hypothetical protein